MANVARLLARFATSSTIAATTGGATSFTVPLAYTDHRAYLVIYNGTTGTIKANIEYGDANQACLGDLDVSIATGAFGVVPFKDSAKYKTMTTNSVTVNLRDTSDAAILATATVHAVLVQD